MSQTYNILVGDVGGTNIRLNIRRISKVLSIPHIIINRVKLFTQKYPSLGASIEEYISLKKIRKLSSICSHRLTWYSKKQ